MTAKRKATRTRTKVVKAWNGTRWMIVSPYQKFEHTISYQRNGAWALFSFVVDEDAEKYKRLGWRAVKVRASFHPIGGHRAKN